MNIIKAFYINVLTSTLSFTVTYVQVMRMNLPYRRFDDAMKLIEAQLSVWRLLNKEIEKYNLFMQSVIFDMTEDK